MAKALFGYVNNLLLPGTGLTATSQVGALPVTNLQNNQGSASTAWQTEAGVTSAALGVTTTSAANQWRAFCLARTNLTTAATVRWRVGPVEALFEETPTFDLNFESGSITAPAGYNFVRASKAWGFNSSGDLTEYANDTLRIVYDPATLACLGALREESRTNQIRNPRCEGAAAGLIGLAGAMPTNWTSTNSNAGMNVWVVGTGTENGIPYVDLQYEGNTGGSAASWRVAFESATQIVAAQAQDWTMSAHCRLIAGSIGDGAMIAEIEEFTAAPALLDFGSEWESTPTNALLRTQRNVFTRTLGHASTARVRPSLVFSFSSGQAVDLTVRVGLPQMERGSIVSSPMMPTAGSPAAFTRAVDRSWVTGLSVDPTIGYSVHIDYTAEDDGGAGSVVLWNLQPSSTAFADSIYGSHSGAFNQVSTTWKDSANGDKPQLTRGSTPQATAVKVCISAGPNGHRMGVNSTALLSNTTPATSNGTLTTLGIAGAVWSGSTLGATAGVFIVRRFVLYAAKALTAGQVSAMAATGSTIDTASLAYDSGTVSAGVAVGYGQSVIAAPAAVSGRACRLDVTDPTNPDGFLNIPLAYAGAAWQPAMNVSPASMFGRDDSTVEFRTRGGQEFPTMLYQARRAEVDFEGILNSEVPQVDAMDAVARTGANILYVPDPDSADRHLNSVFGRLRARADLGFFMRGPERRTWRASIAERL
jgi:hypothetical protein